MADKALGALPAISPISAGSLLYIVDGDGNSRKVTAADLAQWIKTAESIVPASEPLVGARAVRTSDVAVSSGTVPIAWQAADFDTDAFWSAGAPTRITIPAGVSKVVVTGGARIFHASIATNTFLGIVKNGSENWAGTAQNAFTAATLSVSTGPIAVAAGDYFELAYSVGATASRSLIAEARTFFSVHAVEVQPAP